MFILLELPDLREVDFGHVPGRNCEKNSAKDGTRSFYLWRGCTPKTRNPIHPKVLLLMSVSLVLFPCFCVFGCLG
jgi:hypothetical protein